MIFVNMIKKRILFIILLKKQCDVYVYAIYINNINSFDNFVLIRIEIKLERLVIVI